MPTLNYTWEISGRDSMPTGDGRRRRSRTPPFPACHGRQRPSSSDEARVLRGVPLAGDMRLSFGAATVNRISRLLSGPACSLKWVCTRRASRYVRPRLSSATMPQGWHRESAERGLPADGIPSFVGYSYRKSVYPASIGSSELPTATISQPELNCRSR